MTLFPSSRGNKAAANLRLTVPGPGWQPLSDYVTGPMTGRCCSSLGTLMGPDIQFQVGTVAQAQDERRSMASHRVLCRSADGLAVETVAPVVTSDPCRPPPARRLDLTSADGRDCDDIGVFSSDSDQGTAPATLRLGDPGSAQRNRVRLTNPPVLGPGLKVGRALTALHHSSDRRSRSLTSGLSEPGPREK